MATDREKQFEVLLKGFVSCIENVGAQEWWDEGAVDLMYLYDDVCIALGTVPQSYTEEGDEDELTYEQEVYIP